MKKDQVEILGVKVDLGYTLESTVEKIESFLSDEGNHQICTTNPEFILESQQNEVSKSIINNSDLSLPDGVGVLYAHKFLEEVREYKGGAVSPFISFLIAFKVLFLSFLKKDYLGERISGVSLVEKLCSLDRGANTPSIFFLGGWPKNSKGEMLEGEYNVAQEAADSLKKKYPHMNIVGAVSSFGPGEQSDADTLAYIHDCMHRHSIEHIDIILVAYGHPSQELWVQRLSKQIPAKVGIGVGGTFDYFSGRSLLAPAFFVRLNLEWAFRLVTQPWRYRRTVAAFLTFPFLVYKSTLK